MSGNRVISEEEIRKRLKPRVWRRRLLRLGLPMVLFMALGYAVILWGMNRTIHAPPWVAERIEARMNAALQENAPLRVNLGGLSLRVDERGVPRIELNDVRLVTERAEPVAEMRTMRARLDPGAVLKGRLAFRRLYFSGMSLSLTRDADGRLNMAFGTRGAATGNIGELLDAVDRAFENPTLAGLDEVVGERLTFTFDDRRSGRRMAARDGKMTLTQGPRGVVVRFDMGVSSDGSAPSATTVKIETERDGTEAVLSAAISEVATADLAGQSPAFAFLSVLDAPLSGVMRAEIGESGQIDTIAGTMQIEAGQIRPAEGARPIPISRGRTYFSYDRAAARIDFSEVSVVTGAAEIAAQGRAYLENGDDAWPDEIIGQFSFGEVLANPYEALSEPVAFTGGAVDLRLRLAPFRLDIGQLVLSREDQRFRMEGDIRAGPEGWSASMDLALNTIAHDKLLALWPVELAPRTRSWLVRNIRAGTITDAVGAVRTRPGEPPLLSLGYDFSGAEVRFLPSMPTITGGAGHATVMDNTYALVLDAGRIEAPEGGVLDVAGSTFRIPDMREKPARVEVGLKAAGPVRATLALLDRPPFEVLKRAGRGLDLAEGQVTAAADIRFRLEEHLSLDRVDYTVTADLGALRSETVVPGRVITSDAMALRATPARLEIGGQGEIDGVPFDATWARAMAGGEGSRLEGTIELSPRFLDAFGIELPPGSVQGTGTGVFEIALPPEGAPEFRLRSDLAQLALRVDALDWSKRAETPGRLLVEGRLGDRPAVDVIELEAPGLALAGDITLGDDGQLQRARLSRVRAGGWFDAPVTLSGRGAGAAPAVAIGGGTVDMRGGRLGGSGGAGGGSADGGPITFALDRLIITDGISLTGVEGTLSGQSGRLTGRVNGAAPVSATLVPTEQGAAIRVLSDDAGAVFRAADMFEGARRGSLDLTLRPTGAVGTYDGTLNVGQIYLRDAPTMAEILSAISVVGLIEQLDGSGILFSDVSARFRLTPSQIILTQSSAIGPSMGISLDGVYTLANKVMDMQGVVSPIYLLNGVGSIFSRNREGLFGFNFRVRGPVGDPSVSVNPLSILTPGMFRDIFRRPPPRLTQ